MNVMVKDSKKKKAKSFFLTKKNEELLFTLKNMSEQSNSRIINTLLTYIRKEIKQGNTDLIDLKERMELK